MAEVDPVSKHLKSASYDSPCRDTQQKLTSNKQKYRNSQLMRLTVKLGLQVVNCVCWFCFGFY